MKSWIIKKFYLINIVSLFKVLVNSMPECDNEIYHGIIFADYFLISL